MLGSDALDNLYVHEKGLYRCFKYILMLTKGRTRANDNRASRECVSLSKEDYVKVSDVKPYVP